MNESFTQHTIRITHMDGWFYEIKTGNDNAEWIQVDAFDGGDDSTLRQLMTFPPEMARQVASAIIFLADKIELNEGAAK